MTPTERLLELHAHLSAGFRASPPSLASERDLSDSVERLLVGRVYDREHRLTARDRLDFLVGGVAVEVKIAESLAGLTRQCFRYAEHVDVHAILVITTLNRLRRLPPSMCEKPVLVLCLADYLL